jgi:hypothetical protein
LGGTVSGGQFSGVYIYVWPHYRLRRITFEVTPDDVFINPDEYLYQTANTRVMWAVVHRRRTFSGGSDVYLYWHECIITGIILAAGKVDMITKSSLLDVSLYRRADLREGDDHVSGHCFNWPERPQLVLAECHEQRRTLEGKKYIDLLTVYLLAHTLGEA